MAQLVIDNLEDDVRDRLQNLARDHGRTVEEEARNILRAAIVNPSADETGLGTRISQRFAGLGLDHDIPELRGYSAEPPNLEP